MNLAKWILGFVFAMVFSVVANAQVIQGVMMVVKGDVKVTTPDGKTDAAKVGKKVSAGDTITAGADSRAKIVMADKNVINVSPDSKIVIEKYENNGKDQKNVELNVVYGKVRASVEQKYDGDKSKFNVKTPSAVAGVRGTDFLMGYNAGTKKAQVITFSGSVAVGQPGPGGTIKNPVFVQAGQMTQAGSGQAPETPRSVPKEDLNKMNNETKADTASNSKQDSGQNTADNKGDKKDEKKDEKKEDKREPASEDKSKDKKDDKKNDKRDSASEDKSGNRREPASTGGSNSMINSTDLPSLQGPGLATGDGACATCLPPPPPPMNATCPGGVCLPPPPPPPPPPTSGKAKVNIILNPQ